MDKIKNRITDRSPLDLDYDTMKEMGYQVTDIVAKHLSSLRSQPVYVTMPRDEAEKLMPKEPPMEGSSFDAIMQTLNHDVLPNTAREPHPGYIAYVPSCPTFPAVLGDWFVSGFNFFTGLWDMAAGINQMELVVIDWFRQWFGMPQGTGGLMTPGGSAATHTAVVAARHHVLGTDYADITRLVIYASDQAHSSVMKAAWMAGIPRSQVRKISVDDQFKMKVEELITTIHQDRESGLLPLMVVASAGTTNTGTVDPLHEIADFCENEKIWLHIDAAYAGFSILTERGKQALSGIERADSITIDPHKWLFVPFECGCLLARDPSLLRDAFQVNPEYLKDAAASQSKVNFSEYGEQLTRASRALKIWMSVNYFGMQAITEAIDRAMDLTLFAEELMKENPDFEILSPAQFGILCFRIHPKGMDHSSELETLNQEICNRVVAEGSYLIATTRLRGELALRICILGFRTGKEDVEGVVSSVVSNAKAILAESRVVADHSL
ncbi:pyridoxal phosphate-dependent decarboxylase family protein [Brevibacillus daliensis]|uniref:pyridoxal phosphate-dependent decarboxylase family protein n=1 Tax=Brevibacillus daliensis TaxID=2892995 RepID=UPI001E634281|nr:aminotransferase class V-fold PLP-dependent enzyme [Brevibacillus daliensis]